MKPGIVDPKGHDARLDLELLQDQQLFESVARNPDAAHRKLAVLILVERCSPFLRRPEIAPEVEALLATTPGATD